MQTLVSVYGRVHGRRWWLGKCPAEELRRRGDLANAIRQSMVVVVAAECVLVGAGREVMVRVAEFLQKRFSRPFASSEEADSILGGCDFGAMWFGLAPAVLFRVRFGLFLTRFPERS